MKNLLLIASLGLFLACSGDDSTGPSGKTALLDSLPKGSAFGIQWVEMGGVKIAMRNASDSATWEQAKGMCKDGWRLPIKSDLDLIISQINTFSDTSDFYDDSVKCSLNSNYNICMVKERDSRKIRELDYYENYYHNKLGFKGSYYGYDSLNDFHHYLGLTKLSNKYNSVRCVYEPDSTRLKAYLATKCNGPRC